jgi:hypothetical protein
LDFQEDFGFSCEVTASDTRPYLVQRSADLTHWTDILTNQTGGSIAFDYHPAAYANVDYYRTRSGEPSDYSQTEVVGQTPEGRNILRVQDSRQGDTVIWGSDNGVDWVPIYGHEGNVAGTQLTVNQSQGTASVLSTALEAASPNFLESTARGWRKFSVSGLVTSNSFLNLSVLLTNGTIQDLAVTNTANATNVVQFAQALLNAVNGKPELQGTDGITAEDLIPGPFNNAEFNFRSSSPGIAASTIRVTLAGSPGLTVAPSGEVALAENLSDLRPRNNVFVQSGHGSMAFSFPLQTLLLVDGYHELRAVAYEGSHVYSQTHFPLKVKVQNSSLEANLALSGSPTNRPVSDVLQFTVTANTNSVSEIQLWSTGGLIAGITNQAPAVFAFPGSTLGVGWHRFHATVATTNGTRYRTDLLNVNLVAD